MRRGVSMTASRSWWPLLNLGSLIANATLQLPWGKVFTILSVRGSFLVSIAVFEVGSLICALSPSSLALILGRAVAGIGCGGIVVGVYT